VVAVEVTDVGEEAAHAQVEAGGQRSGVDVRLFDADVVFAVFAVDGRGQLAVELVVDVGGEGDLALAEREAIRARAGLARQREAGTDVGVRIERMMRIAAVEDDADRRIEGVGIAAAAASAGRRRYRRGDVASGVTASGVAASASISACSLDGVGAAATGATGALAAAAPLIACSSACNALTCASSASMRRSVAGSAAWADVANADRMNRLSRDFRMGTGAVFGKVIT
jgi:hypothetical protein